MDIAAPTHVIVDHINNGGPSPWVNILIAAGSAIAVAIAGGLIGVWGSMRGRAGERKHEAERQEETRRREICAELNRAIVQLALALMQKDNPAKNLALSEVIAAIDAIRYTYQADNYHFVMRLLKEREWMMKKLVAPIDPGMGTDDSTGLLRLIPEVVQSWLNDPVKYEAEHQSGVASAARSQQQMEKDRLELEGPF
jgi:hypothetical protein